MKKIDILQFICYPEYLKAYFDARKREDPSFSHRYLSKRLGLSSPNFIMMLMQGKRKLSRTLTTKISREFKHTSKEAEYFECMVGFSRAATPREKDKYFSRMTELRKRNNVRKLEDFQYEFYSNWYNLPIRELVTYPEFKGNYNWLAKRVFPAITPGQAKRSVELLFKLKLIKKNGNIFVRSTPLLSTGPEVSSFAVANFHRTMARLGAASIDSVQKDERDITACTINISLKGYEKIKETIAECRSKILSLAEDDIPADRVYQMNFHMFPVSKIGYTMTRSIA
jgi:uncharacterized protein (TIGR02147 family)